jgi:NAD(P)-dependent dehydrogenase (short-subunit alcohol dehydrogenase family)
MMRAGWLGDKVALVTGGGSGIGRAVVDAFLAEGARVAVLELDAEKCAQLRALDSDVLVVEGDATAPAANREAVAATVDRFGRLDALATFVGVFDLYTPLAEIPDESFEPAFQETFGVNVKSVMPSVRAALPELRGSGGSVVVTLSSSSFYPGRGGALYVSSKFALRGLVLQLARDLAPDVRVNGVAPGGTVRTDLRGLRSLGQSDTVLDARPGREEHLRARTPLQLALEPDDHAGAYVFLASDRARGITGEVVRSDGGLAAR